MIEFGINFGTSMKICYSSYQSINSISVFIRRTSRFLHDFRLNYCLIVAKERIRGTFFHNHAVSLNCIELVFKLFMLNVITTWSLLQTDFMHFPVTKQPLRRSPDCGLGHFSLIWAEGCTNLINTDRMTSMLIICFACSMIFSLFLLLFFFFFNFELQ